MSILEDAGDDLSKLASWCKENGLRPVAHRRVAKIVEEHLPPSVEVSQLSDAAFLRLGLVDPSVLLVCFDMLHPAALERRPPSFEPLKRACRTFALFAVVRGHPIRLTLIGPRAQRPFPWETQQDSAAPVVEQLPGNNNHVVSQQEARSEAEREAEEYEAQRIAAEAEVERRYGQPWIRISQDAEDGTRRITEYRRARNGGVIFLHLADDDVDLEVDEPLAVRRFRTLTGALKHTLDPERTPMLDRMCIEVSGDQALFTASLRRAGVGVFYFDFGRQLLGFDGEEIVDARLAGDDAIAAQDALRAVWRFRAFVETSGPWDRDIEEMVGEAGGVYYYVLAGDEDHCVIKLGRFATVEGAIRAGKLRSPRTEPERRRLARAALEDSPSYAPRGIKRAAARAPKWNVNAERKAAPRRVQQ